MKIRSTILLPLSLSLAVAGSLVISAPVAAASSNAGTASHSQVARAAVMSHVQTVASVLPCVAKYNFTANFDYNFNIIRDDWVQIKGTACANGSTSWGYSVSYGSGTTTPYTNYGLSYFSYGAGSTEFWANVGTPHVGKVYPRVNFYRYGNGWIFDCFDSTYSGVFGCSFS